MRTVIWFIYFCGYLLVHLPALNRGKRALKRGDFAVSDAIALKHVPRWCKTLVRLAGVSITVTGAENIPADRPCLFVANHRSLYDIPIMLTQLGGPIALVSKIEAQKIPVIRGWMSLLHCLFLDRSNPRQGMQIISDAAQLIEQGYSVGIFPEGTRYKGPEGEMGTFLDGSFRIATKTGAPVVPVVIGNARACLEGDGHFTMKPAHVTVQILPAIETAAMTRPEQKALPKLAEQQVREALSKTVS